MVQIVIDNITSKIVGFLPDEIHDDLYRTLSYKAKDARYMWKVKNKMWDGVYRLYYQHKSQSFYSGLISLVTTVLDKYKIQYQFKDIREKPEANLPLLTFSPPSFYESRPYQQFTIERSLQKTRGILKVATGGGKTMLVTELISRIQTAPFMFYVLSIDLMEQAYDTLSSTLNEPIGMIGGDKFDIQNINVCTIQTAIRAINADNSNFKISDYLFDDDDANSWDIDQMVGVDKLKSLQNLIASTKGIYMDETHHAAARTCREVLSSSPYAYWKYGGSATPYREDGAEIVLQGLFGKKIVDISASYLIDHGYLIEPYIIFVPINHDINVRSWKSIYSQCICKNDQFNIDIANMSNYFISHGLSTLILVKEYAQGDFIKKLIPNSEFLNGRISNGDKRKKIIQDLRDKKIGALIATSLADEGLDIVNLDVAVLAGGGASATRVHQRIGRTLRIDRNAEFPRNKSIVIYPQHNVKYLKDHASKAKRIIKTEPRFHIVNSNGMSYVCDEVNQIMELGGRSKTIMEL